MYLHALQKGEEKDQDSNPILPAVNERHVLAEMWLRSAAGCAITSLAPPFAVHKDFLLHALENGWGKAKQSETGLPPLTSPRPGNGSLPFFSAQRFLLFQFF